jgi:Cu2+-exporting ATPase
LLIRDRIALEEARLIDTVVFDKTGTLTEGRFGVVSLKVVDGWSEEEAISLAAALETDSEHSVAQAILKFAEERKIRAKKLTNFMALKGRGVKANLGESEVYLGGNGMLDLLGLKLPPKLQEFANESSAKSYSTIYLVVGKNPVACFALADVVRAESREAIEKLHRLNLKVAMLTGDNEAVARKVAEELGIDLFYSELLPEKKVEKVVELQKQGRKVAMVGDGVNDAPALVQADVGIAIGGGTDVAIESADIILVKNNPLDVVKVFTLSKASYRKMVQNLWWAAGYNLIAIPLAAGVLASRGIVLSPAIGALFMSLSTLIVALNAQFLRNLRFN